jgi:hypothetical protein
MAGNRLNDGKRCFVKSGKRDPIHENNRISMKMRDYQKDQNRVSPQAKNSRKGIVILHRGNLASSAEWLGVIMRQ